VWKSLVFVEKYACLRVSNINHHYFHRFNKKIDYQTDKICAYLLNLCYRLFLSI